MWEGCALKGQQNQPTSSLRRRRGEQRRAGCWVWVGNCINPVNSTVCLALFSDLFICIKHKYNVSACDWWKETDIWNCLLRTIRKPVSTHHLEWIQKRLYFNECHKVSIIDTWKSIIMLISDAVITHLIIKKTHLNSRPTALAFLELPTASHTLYQLHDNNSIH